MNGNQHTRKRIFLAGGAIIGWTAVSLQLHLILQNRVASVPETVIRFFSFYTILTNILVALCFTILLTGTTSRAGHFFGQSKNLTAIAVYIGMVGIVYNLILRFLWKPQGLQRVVDELLHVVTPLLFISYWLLIVSKQTLNWKDVFPWLVYPLVYVVVILVRGAVSGFYPYPFINVGKLGYPRVLFNSLGLFLLFLIFSLFLVALAKWMNRKK